MKILVFSCWADVAKRLGLSSNAGLARLLGKAASPGRPPISPLMGINEPLPRETHGGPPDWLGSASSIEGLGRRESSPVTSGTCQTGLRCTRICGVAGFHVIQKFA